MFYSIIALPSNFVASTTANVSDLFGDFSPIITLILGILGVAIVIEIIIGAFRRH
jgi:hypothetical protein